MENETEKRRRVVCGWLRREALSLWDESIAGTGRKCVRGLLPGQGTIPLSVRVRDGWAEFSVERFGDCWSRLSVPASDPLALCRAVGRSLHDGDGRPLMFYSVSEGSPLFQ